MVFCGWRGRRDSQPLARVGKLLFAQYDIQIKRTKPLEDFAGQGAEGHWLHALTESFMWYNSLRFCSKTELFGRIHANLFSSCFFVIFNLEDTDTGLESKNDWNRFFLELGRVDGQIRFVAVHKRRISITTSRGFDCLQPCGIFFLWAAQRLL